MAMKITLSILVCLVVVQSAFSMSNTNNGRGNRGGGIHGQLNGQQGVANSRIRAFLPQPFKHVIPADSEEDEPIRLAAAHQQQDVDTEDDTSQQEESIEETSEPTVFIRPTVNSPQVDALQQEDKLEGTPEPTVVIRPIVHKPQGLLIQGGRGNNNGNNNNDGRSHGNGCNTNNNGNNNEDDDCQGGKIEIEQVTVMVPPAPVHEKKPAVDNGNDGAAGKPTSVELTEEDLDFDKMEEDLDKFDIDDDLDDYIYSDDDNEDIHGGSDDNNRFNYRSLFSNSRLARIMSYRYWLRQFLPRYREYYRSRSHYY